MRLSVRVPVELLLEEAGVERLATRTEDGAFTVLERHLDFVTTVVPGLVAYSVGDRERFVAVDRGVIVKHGGELRLAVRDAVVGEDLERLRDAVHEHLRRRDERERQAISAVARLESNLVRGFIDLGWDSHE